MLEAYGLSPEAFTSSVAERQDLPIEWWAARMADAADAPAVVVGAFAGERLVGAAGLAFKQRERTRHKATLFGMYVRPTDCGKGVGAQLVEEVLRQARASGRVELVQLTVSASNHRAIELYRRCGFTPFGSEPMAVKLGETFIAKVHMWQRISADTP
jgi:ribosomal protein S18 acetylase RimI-like enzyme